MARITVEDCLDKVDNRFALIHLAAKRVRALRKGSDPLVVCKNEDIVTSLREIAEGKIFQVKVAPEDLLTEGVDVPEVLEPPKTIPEELKAEGKEDTTEAASPIADDSAPEAVEKDT